MSTRQLIRFNSSCKGTLLVPVGLWIGLTRWLVFFCSDSFMSTVILSTTSFWSSSSTLMESSVQHTPFSKHFQKQLIHAQEELDESEYLPPSQLPNTHNRPNPK